VNDELSAIKKSLPAAIELLASGGRICAISFHSLEDRLVKDAFRRAARGCVCDEEHCRCNNEPRAMVITKKPVLPGAEEIAKNKRARSARLRVAEKL
jgi:16S rRNA (cytosine1402-N4)-methyltransferase